MGGGGAEVGTAGLAWAAGSGMRNQPEPVCPSAEWGR